MTATEALLGGWYGDANVRMRDCGGFDTLAQEAQRNVQTLIRYARTFRSAFAIAASNVHTFGVSAGGVVALRLAMRSDDADLRAERSTTGENGQRSQVRSAVGVSALEWQRGPACRPSGHGERYGGDDQPLGMLVRGRRRASLWRSREGRHGRRLDVGHADLHPGHPHPGARNLCEAYPAGAPPQPGHRRLQQGRLRHPVRQRGAAAGRLAL